MSHTFKVGEIAELIYARYHSQACPVDVRITTSLVPQFDDIAGCYVLAYGIELGGRDYYAIPEQLRKRRPPQDWVKLCNLTDVPREVSHV